jgi:phage baseplate assembly protein W
MPKFDNAWRFDFPAEQKGKSGISLSKTGGIEMVDAQRSIKQSILMILSTVPGERVMRPRYGCDLFKLVFSPNDDTTAGLAIHYVKTALTMWEKRIEVVHVDAEANPDNAVQMDISLAYRIKTRNVKEELNYTFMLSGKES